METFAKLNCFTDRNYVQFKSREGVLRTKTGTRLCAVGADFLQGFVTALEYEVGPAAPAILKRCGEFYGARVAKRFETELIKLHGQSVRDRNMGEFQVLLTDFWNALGMGTLQIEWEHGPQGFLPIILEDSPMQDIGPKGHKSDDLFTGIFEGFFNNFIGGSIKCIQTGDTRLGSKDGTTFIIAVERFQSKIGELVAAETRHRDIVQELVGVA